MAKVLLMVDNSNIHVETINSFDSSARFSYPKFEKLKYGNDVFVGKHVIGSTPPAVDTFWKTMRNKGYSVHTYERKQIFERGRNRTIEKGVDGAIIANGVEALIKKKPDVLVILSGDLDMLPLLEKAKEYNCKVHIWSYSSSISENFEKAGDEVFYIDDYKDDLIYYQNADGSVESYSERKTRLEKEHAEWVKEQRKKERKRKKKQSEDGCYIATAVYGSYDCHQVWVLRRFRDYSLSESFIGKSFIKFYYATSPTIVRCFGKTKMFSKFWRSILDRFVFYLEKFGIQNTPYKDK